MRHLVTPSGAKTSHTEADLAGYCNVSPERLHPLLESLARDRLVRPVEGIDGWAGAVRDLPRRPGSTAAGLAGRVRARGGTRARPPAAAAAPGDCRRVARRARDPRGDRGLRARAAPRREDCGDPGAGPRALGRGSRGAVRPILSRAWSWRSGGKARAGRPDRGGAPLEPARDAGARCDPSRRCGRRERLRTGRAPAGREQQRIGRRLRDGRVAAARRSRQGAVDARRLVAGGNVVRHRRPGGHGDDPAGPGRPRDRAGAHPGADRGARVRRGRAAGREWSARSPALARRAGRSTRSPSRARLSPQA